MFLSEWREFPSAPCLAEKEKPDISRLDVVEIARVPDMLPSLFPSCSGAKDLSARRSYRNTINISYSVKFSFTINPNYLNYFGCECDFHSALRDSIPSQGTIIFAVNFPSVLVLL